MCFVSKIIRKIVYFANNNSALSQLNFANKKARKTCKMGNNVSIYNQNVTVGNNVTFYDGVIVWGSGKIIIEDNVKIGFHTILYAHEGSYVRIGKNTAIAANCYVIDTNHSTKELDTFSGGSLGMGDECSPIDIGASVWIAAHCVIAKGVTLGNGCIVGANSFVNKDVPENAIVGGTPAKIIKFRGE